MAGVTSINSLISIETDRNRSMFVEMALVNSHLRMIREFRIRKQSFLYILIYNDQKRQDQTLIFGRNPYSLEGTLLKKGSFQTILLKL